ncbi:hypothetical protein [Cupriavidus pauculus]|uniref:hypothetical protein n=1 Tax=Cupriavidus pauculus TaxID=82633 RepID=UPI001D0C54FE|nr:hypothetical protein [Cupriavidus pauculus]
MVIATISATLSSLKASVELARSAIALRDDAKLAEATQALNDRIIDVQNAALQLQEKQSAARDEIDSLKDEARELRARVAELEQKRILRSNYKLHELCEGSFALAPVGPAGQATEPMHYLCQTCMDNESKQSVLQEERSMGKISLKCPSCNNTYRTGRRYEMPRLNRPAYVL